MRKEQLKQVFRLSRVPVKLWAQKKIEREAGRYYGFFDREKGYIVCSNEPSNIYKSGIILHEMGHAECMFKECKCWTDRVQTETHAQVFALKKSIELKKYDVLKKCMQIVIDWAKVKNKKAYPEYIKASEKIMRKPIWKHCEKLLKENNETL
jgi:hypothetical protein